MRHWSILFLLISCRALAQNDWEPSPLPRTVTVHGIAFSAPTATHTTGHLCLATSDGVFASTDAGMTWSDVTGNLPSRSVSAIAATDNKYLTIATDTGIFLGQIGGTWKAASDPLNATNVYAFAVNTLSGLYAATDNGIHYSLDRGDRWFPLGFFGLTVLSIAVDPSAVLYAGLPPAGQFNGIHLSSDFGLTWDQILDDDADFQALAITSVDGLIAGAYDRNRVAHGIRRTTVDLTTWVESGLINSSVSTLARGEETFVYAGIRRRTAHPDTITFEGVHESTDLGVSWREFNDGLTDRDVRVLFHHDERLFAGTSSGLFKRNVSGSTDARVPMREEAVSVSLSPHPVTSTAAFQFKGPARSAPVTIEINNALGVTVASLTLLPGQDYTTWNTGNLPNGFYTMRTRGTGAPVEKRFLVLR